MSRSSVGGSKKHGREHTVRSAEPHIELDEDDDGTTRGAHLKLAQRHRKLVAGRFRGRCVVEPEEAAPGVLGQLAICFTTNGALPSETRITCELPDHGWRVLAAADPITSQPTTATGPTRVNAVMRLPQGCTAPNLKTLWYTATHTLEFALLATTSSDATTTFSTIASDTPVVLLVAGVYTPEAATPQAECVVTAFEKRVVRPTVPVTTRGGQVIDGPCRFLVPKLVPGQLTGPKRWLPFSCVPRAVSDVSLSFSVNGAVPRGGRILIELPHDGWDMPECPRVLLRTAASRNNSVVSAVWTRLQHALEITLDTAAAVPMKSRVTLTVERVQNPADETYGKSDVKSGNDGINSAARITTLSSNGGVVDGPSKLDVASISELRDCDLASARVSFDTVDVDSSGSIAIASLPSVFARANVQLSDALYLSLVVANLPARITHAATDSVQTDTVNSGLTIHYQHDPSTADTDALQLQQLGPDRITRSEFLSVFARVFAPAYRFGQELRRACGRGDVDCVREWLSRGCDPSATDGAGWCALHYAADFGQLDVLSVLLEPTMSPVPPHVDARDGCGWTPLLCAAANGHTRVVEALLAAGADVQVASAEGRTALHWASARDMVATAIVLLDNGADVAVVDRSGWSALHCAVLHSSASCMTLLIERGASAAVVDRLEYAAAKYDAVGEQ